MKQTDRSTRGQYFAITTCHLCGKTNHPVVPGVIKSGRAKSCGCSTEGYAKITGERSKQFTGYKEIRGKWWGNAKRRAERRSVPFNLELKEAWDLYKQQNRKCALSGLPIEFGKHNGETTASLDRIDITQGYTIHNVQWVHKHLNIMRNVFPIDYFVEVCGLVSEMTKDSMKMKITYIEGDLFANLPCAGGVVIPHVVNNKNAWGAGFVIPLGHKFPKAMESYRQWYSEREAKNANYEVVPFKLGNTLIQQVQWDNDDNCIYVAHMIAQDGLPSARERHPLKYDHLESCLKQVQAFASQRELSIYCPLFGAGIAGGDWYKIEQMVRECWTKNNITVTCFYLKDKLPPGWTPPVPRKS